MNRYEKISEHDIDSMSFDIYSTWYNKSVGKLTINMILNILVAMQKDM